MTRLTKLLSTTAIPVHPLQVPGAYRVGPIHGIPLTLQQLRSGAGMATPIPGLLLRRYRGSMNFPCGGPRIIPGARISQYP